MGVKTFADNEAWAMRHRLQIVNDGERWSVLLPADQGAMKLSEDNSRYMAIRRAHRAYYERLDKSQKTLRHTRLCGILNKEESSALPE